MLLYLLFSMLVKMINGLFSLFPVVEILPFGIDSVLVQGVAYLQFLITVFPPLGLMLDAMLIVISFKLILKAVAMIPIFLGPNNLCVQFLNFFIHKITLKLI